MPGLIGDAPIYLNGVLSLLFVFVLPGLALVSFLDIPDFPRRWLVVFLTSLTVSHALVILVAALHLDPLLAFRFIAAALVAVIIVGTIRRRGDAGGSAQTASDLRLLAAGIVLFGIAYFNVWKRGVPSIFDEGDVSISWNSWALIWSKGNFSSAALGYPQFIPTLWAVTYIFSGSVEQYFAHYIYLGLITIPLLLTLMALGRVGWWQPLMFGLSFVWFIAEIQEPWLRSTLPEGYPDWVVVAFSFCGFALFVVDAPQDSFDRTKRLVALTAISMLSIATATKPISGLIAIAVLATVVVDGIRRIEPAERNRFVTAAIGIVAVFAVLYGIYYAHLAARGMPHYPTTELSQRLLQTWRLFNASFSWPFKIVIALGLVCGPFLPRIRSVMLPLYIGLALWANTASYDLRNVLGFVLIGAFIAIYNAGRISLAKRTLGLRHAQWHAADGVVVAVLAVLVFGVTSPLAMSDSDIKRRFASDQLGKGLGVGFNGEIAGLLDRGCTLFSSTTHFYTIHAFQRHRSRIEFFYFTHPPDAAIEQRFRDATNCVAILYPSDRTTPALLAFIDSFSQARGLQKLREDRGMILMASR